MYDGVWRWYYFTTQCTGNIRVSHGIVTNPDVSADDDVLYSELVQFLWLGISVDKGISA
jgi:hypothetical protein